MSRMGSNMAAKTTFDMSLPEKPCSRSQISQKSSSFRFNGELRVWICSNDLQACLKLYVVAQIRRKFNRRTNLAHYLSGSGM